MAFAVYSFKKQIVKNCFIHLINNFVGVDQLLSINALAFKIILPETQYTNYPQ